MPRLEGFISPLHNITFFAEGGGGFSSFLYYYYCYLLLTVLLLTPLVSFIFYRGISLIVHSLSGCCAGPWPLVVVQMNPYPYPSYHAVRYSARLNTHREGGRGWGWGGHDDARFALVGETWRRFGFRKPHLTWGPNGQGLWVRDRLRWIAGGLVGREGGKKAKRSKTLVV